MAKTKDSTQSPEDMIAQALAEAQVTSGAASLPAAHEVPLATAAGAVVSNEVPVPSKDILAASMQIAAMDNPDCPAALKQQAAQVAEALSIAPPPAAPVQVGRGPNTIMVPPSIRTAPFELHTKNPNRAKALWNAFCGAEFKPTLARLAAQGGFTQWPFLYLAQAIFQLLEIDHFYIVKRESDNPFHPDEKSGSIQAGLLEWAGGDVARILTRACEQAGVSILDGLKQCYSELERKQKAVVEQTQKAETTQEWAK
jgi:hypothetical protein